MGLVKHGVRRYMLQICNQMKENQEVQTTRMEPQSILSELGARVMVALRGHDSISLTEVQDEWNKNVSA